MNWRTNIQVLDLEPTDRFELTCRKCKKIRYLTGEELLARKSAKYLYLDDVQRRARCREYGCGGAMKMAMLYSHRVSPFVGGLA